jgi:hypothetical protein
MSYLSKNFTTEEGQCRCGCGFGSKPEEYPLDILALVQGMRDIKRGPLHVNSWGRCARYNAQVGGVDGSAHTRLTAVDLGAAYGLGRYDLILLAVLAALKDMHNIPGMDWPVVFLTVRDALRGIGVGQSFVHVDVDRISPRPSAWGYGSEGGGG